MTNARPLLVLLLCVAGASSLEAAGLLPGASGNEPYKIDANKLDYIEKENRFVYTGDVVAVQGASKMRSSVMTVYVNKAGDDGQQGSVRRVEMTGPVTLNLKKAQSGTSDQAIYDRAENKWYMNGNVTWTDCGNVTKGRRLIYDMIKQRAVFEGRVSTTLIPGKTCP